MESVTCQNRPQVWVPAAMVWALHYVLWEHRANIALIASQDPHSIAHCSNVRSMSILV